MMASLVAQALGEFLIGYAALFSIINPVGVAFVFYEMSRWITPRERAALARTVALYGFCVLVVSLFVGAQLLAFFGVSINALRIAGGLAVAHAGWRMLNAPPGGDRQAPAAMDTAPLRSMAFFPLTVPLTTGPGSIAAAIALGANRPDDGRGLAVSAIASMLLAAAVALTIYLAFRYAAAIARRLGPQGTTVATRLSAFLLLCIGVQIVLTGVLDTLRPLVAPPL